MSPYYSHQPVSDLFCLVLSNYFLAMLGEPRGYNFDDSDCRRTNRHIQEVDLDSAANVTIDGCDSRVKDILLDAEKCSYLIGDGIGRCKNSPRTNVSFSLCVENFMEVLLQNNTITSEEAAAITACARLPVSRNLRG